MNLLAEVLGGAADGALVVDEEYRIALWNDAAAGILGQTASEVVGLRCYEALRGVGDLGEPICSPDCRVMAASRQGRGTPSFELSVCSRSGPRVWISVSTLPGPAERRRECSVIHLFHSVQHQKRLRDFARQVIVQVHELVDGGVASTPGVRRLGPAGARLTRREQEVLRLLAQGLSVKAIAGALSISPATVRGHTQHILDKLDVNSRVQAVVYALDHGLVT